MAGRMRRCTYWEGKMDAGRVDCGVILDGFESSQVDFRKES